MRGLISRRDGNVAVIVALCGTMFIGSAGLAVDAGSVFLTARRTQGAADLAAIAAATSMRAADAHVTARDNLGGRPRVSVVFGRYVPDAALDPEARFTPGGAADAARVIVEAQAPLFFGAALAGRKSLPVHRTAVAAQARMGAFGIGSRLAALRGGVANALLSGLTGSAVTLSVMDYRALVDADVSLFGYLDALRIDTNLAAASYRDLLDADIATPVALAALSRTLAVLDQTAEAGIVARLSAATSEADTVRLGGIVDLGPYAQQDQIAAPVDLSVSAYDLASMVLKASNASRQVELDLKNAGVPGLGDVKAWLAIGEPPTGAAWLAIGPEGVAQVRTAQARLFVETEILGVAAAPLRLPILVELASAEARLADVACAGSPQSHSMRVDVRPALATARIADVDRDDLDRFTRPLATAPATVLRVPAVRLLASAEARLGAKDWRSVTFTGREIAEHAIKTVASRGFTKGVASSLAEDMDIEARALGVSLSPATRALTTAAGGAIAAAAPALDVLIESLLDAAGLSLGEADVQAAGVRCLPAALVG